MVEHSDIRAHFFEDSLVAINGEYIDVQNIDITVAISEKEAVQKAIAHIGAKLYLREGNKESENGIYDTLFSVYPQAELVICKNNMDKQDTNFHLAYKMVIDAKEIFSSDYVYVDAKTGNILSVHSLIKNANGTAQTRYSGTQPISIEPLGTGYSLRDNSRGGGIETYNLNHFIGGVSLFMSNSIDFLNNSTTWSLDTINKDNGALDAHWGAMMVYDYFKEVHDRNSYDNNNGVIRNFTHYSVDLRNAYWNGGLNYIYYGDGDNINTDAWTSLDLVAHEFGHGLCRYEVYLAANGEPAALEEGLSDIWGVCVKNYVNKKYGLNKPIWLMGCDIILNPNYNCLRNLQNPKSSLSEEGRYTRHGYFPDTYKGRGWDNGNEPHTNSTVLSHWFYLLCEGGSGVNDLGNAYNVRGIGIEKAEKLLYYTEKYYMTTGTDYHNMRILTIEVGKNRGLFGGGNTFFNKDMESLSNAWYAVGVKKRGVDLMIADEAGDIGIEPNIAGGTSLDSCKSIWIRHTYQYPFIDTVHQNPQRNAVNYIHVRVKNIGTDTSFSGQVKIYWAKSDNTNPDHIPYLQWTSNWNGGTFSPGLQRGNLIDSVRLPVIPAGGENVVIVPWTVPNPIDYAVDSISDKPTLFYLLARIETEDDPMTFEESFYIRHNCKYNNNIACRSINIESSNLMIRDNQSDIGLEPNTYVEYIYESPDIKAVTKNSNQSEHQNVLYNKQDYEVQVSIKNIGSMNYIPTVGDSVYVYYVKSENASHWRDSNYKRIGAVPLQSALNINGVYTVSIPWVKNNIPNPADYSGDSPWLFYLLAEIRTKEDYFNGSGYIGNCIKNSNNLAGRSVNIGDSVDLWIKDTWEDIGNEPNTDSKIFYVSEDIWVRTQPDGFTNQQHQSPKGNTWNYVYVKVRNRSTIPFVNNGEKVALYWSKAGSNLGWSEAWDGTRYFDAGKTMLVGAPIGENAISSILPGDSTIIAFSWLVPNAADYQSISRGDAWHFCLLARILAPNSDPMKYEKKGNVGDNVQNENNIAMRNISLVQLMAVAGSPPSANQEISPLNASIVVSGTTNNSSCIKFKTTNASSLLFHTAEVTVKLDDVLYQAWLRGGSQSEDMVYIDNQNFRITGQNACLNNLALYPEEWGLLSVQFNFLTRKPTTQTDFQLNTLRYGQGDRG